MNQENGKDVVLIDAYNLFYRAYYGNQSKLTTSTGIPTNAIYTVSKMLLNLPKKFSNLVYAAAVFDGGDNFRKELDAEYKANRSEMPDDLKQQVPYIKRAFELLGWPILQAVGVEADDVVSTLAIRSSKKGFNTYVVSGDKDFRQIINDNLNIIDTMYDICYDREKTFEKMGVYPENVAAYLALLGDSSDNIKGIDKLGKKTAAKLLNEYGSIEGIIQNKDNIKGVVGENLREAIANGQLEKSYTLTLVKTDVPVEISKDSISKKSVNIDEWNKFCDDLEMSSLKIKNSPKP